MNPRLSSAARALYLAIGLGLLWIVLSSVDLDDVASAVWTFGGAALALVMAIYAMEFLCDTLSWQLTLTKVPPQPRWTARLFLTRLVGEAVNSVTPLASMGGEPVKAMLLKQRYGISLSDGAASLVIAKTLNLLSLVVFLAVGFALLVHDDRLAAGYKTVAAVGLATLTFATGAFFVAQRYRLSTTVGRWIGRGRFGRRVAHALAAVEAFDETLVTFYTAERLRLAAAIGLSLANWMVGVLGTWFIFRGLGAPMSFHDAWMIEAVAQLVRAGTFLIPASLGAQEGALVVIASALTGSPALGLAAAIIRRVREIIWIALGILAGYAIAPGAVRDSLRKK